MRVLSALVVSSLAIGAFAQATQKYLGFNSGATFDNYVAKKEKDWLEEFEAAKQLPGTNGLFTAVRLFTCRQANTEDDIIEAIPAAIATNTSILLGVWASGTTNITLEISALQKAITKYGERFTRLVIGVSIGSEDVYRSSERGVENNAGIGNSPSAIVRFIDDFKKAFANTALRDIPVGHVDTWEVWPTEAMKVVIEAVDFIGLDAYSYYEKTQDNDILNVVSLFDTAYGGTQRVANGKPIWLTEIGWPTSGPKWGQGIPSIANAKYFWDQIGCGKLFNKMPTFWYILRDSNPVNNMKFAITEKNNLKKPLFDLSCPANSGSGFDGSAAASNTPKVDSIRGAASQLKLSSIMYASIVVASAFIVL